MKPVSREVLRPICVVMEGAPKIWPLPQCRRNRHRDCPKVKHPLIPVKPLGDGGAMSKAITAAARAMQGLKAQKMIP